MSYRLAGINAKIERADQHIRDLGARIDAFLKLHVQSVIGEYDHEQGLQVLKFPPIPPTPLIFSVIAGEIVGHLRSSFDHLIAQLVYANGNTPDPRRDLFPVNRLESEYIGSGRRKIERISSTAQTLVDGLQPYKRGDKYRGHPLFVLNKLAVADKHRTLSVMVASARLRTVQVAATERDIISIVQRPPAYGVRLSAERETELLVTELPDGSGPMDMEAKVSVNVVFDEPPVQGQPVVPSLYQLMQFSKSAVFLFADAVAVPEHS